ncbi:MAG: S-methyl-5-thioribose-1-phosphate isomerase, partial [Candidatus Competibacteraceae bacterium]|nr:S-methyl-5-thioribose-1-phosphate isomerase [Candidatus Competibacteraceae bacterium]
MISYDYDHVRALVWRDDALELLDQRLLPKETCYQRLTTAAEVAEAIRCMVVRGAPAIGIAAAYGVVLAARAGYTGKGGRWQISLEEDLDRLAASRPTAINLFWALQRMKRIIAQMADDPLEQLLNE